MKRKAKCIYQNYFRMLFLYIYQKVQDYELSKDLLQDAFMKYYQHRDSLEDSCIGGWLKTVASRLCIDHYRKTVRIRLSMSKLNHGDPVEQKDQSALTTQNGPSRICIEEVFTLHQLLEKVPEKDRKCFHLHVFEGYTKKEVSGLLGISERTVMRKVKWVKTKLASELK